MLKSLYLCLYWEMRCLSVGNLRLLMPVWAALYWPATPAATRINGWRATVDLSSQVLVLVVDTDTHQIIRRTRYKRYDLGFFIDSCTWN